MTDDAATPTAGAPDTEALFRQYVLPELDVMYRVARTMTRNHDDAEDLVQDALVRAYRAIDRFDGRYPRAWLITILRNTQINRVRRKRPGLLADPELTIEQQLADEDPSVDPEYVVVDPVFDEHVQNALDELPDRFRSVVQIVDIDGRSYNEASEELGVPIGTVMSRLHRARKRLRKSLGDAGVSLGAGGES